MNFEQSIVGIGGAAFIMALIEFVKPFISDHRWCPVIALALGLAINIGYAWGFMTLTTPQDWMTAVFAGIMAGMAASGFYSGANTMTKGG